MLGKKELAVILVILICVCVYFYYEYLSNQLSINQQNNDILEGFEISMTKQKKIDDMKKINMNMFSFYKTFLDNEMLYYKNDIDIVNYFIVKKFNLKRIIQKTAASDGKIEYVKNPKFDKFIKNRKLYLENIINNLDFVKLEIENLSNNHSVNNKFYNTFKIILSDILDIYKDKLSYFIEGNANYFDIETIIKINDNTGDTEYLDNLNKYLSASKGKFRLSVENIEKNINELFKFMEITSEIDKNVRNILIDLFKYRLNVLSKIVVRDLTIEIIDTVGLLAVSNKISGDVVDEKIDAAKKSNKQVTELKDNLNLEINTTDKLVKFFNDNEMGIIILNDDEFKYFNSVDKNTKMLEVFCKKMKKVNRPSNSNFLFKRFAKEYVDKKNKQIVKLDNEINQLMGVMTVKQAYDNNLYNLRTSEDAQKQMNVINKAKENIDTIGKIKLNIK